MFPSSKFHLFAATNTTIEGTRALPVNPDGITTRRKGRQTLGKAITVWPALEIKDARRWLFWNVTGSFHISHWTSPCRPSFLAVDIGYVCRPWFTVKIDIFEQKNALPILGEHSQSLLFSILYVNICHMLSCLRTLRLIVIWAEQHTTTTSKLS